MLLTETDDVCAKGGKHVAHLTQNIPDCVENMLTSSLKRTLKSLTCEVDLKKKEKIPKPRRLFCSSTCSPKFFTYKDKTQFSQMSKREEKQGQQYKGKKQKDS